LCAHHINKDLAAGRGLHSDKAVSRYSDKPAAIRTLKLAGIVHHLDI
jgi:hypothetical protein